MRILLVEDDSGIAQAIAEQARMWNLKVFWLIPVWTEKMHFSSYGSGYMISSC